MRMYQILNFKTFYDIIREKDMPIKTAYKFSKLSSKINEEIKFYQEHISQILEKYGEKDQDGNFVFIDNGKSIKIREDLLADCQKEINELDNLEIKIEEIKFSLDELSFINLKLSDIELLMPLIEE